MDPFIYNVSTMPQLQNRKRSIKSTPRVSEGQVCAMANAGPYFATAYTLYNNLDQCLSSNNDSVIGLITSLTSSNSNLIGPIFNTVSSFLLIHKGMTLGCCQCEEVEGSQADQGPGAGEFLQVGGQPVQQVRHQPVLYQVRGLGAGDPGPVEVPDHRWQVGPRSLCLQVRHSHSSQVDTNELSHVDGFIKCKK